MQRSRPSHEDEKQPQQGEDAVEKPKKQKRPEMQRYVPKPRQEAAKGQTEENKNVTKPMANTEAGRSAKKEEVWDESCQVEPAKTQISGKAKSDRRSVELAKNKQVDNKEKEKQKGKDSEEGGKGSVEKIKSPDQKPGLRKPHVNTVERVPRDSEYRPRSQNKNYPLVKSPDPRYVQVSSPGPNKNRPLGRGRRIRTPEPDRPLSSASSRVATPDLTGRRGVAEEDRKAAIDAVTKFMKSGTSPVKVEREPLKEARNVPRYSQRRLSKQESKEDGSMSPTQLIGLGRPPLPPSRSGTKSKQQENIERVASPTELLQSRTSAHRRHIVSRSPSPSALLQNPPRTPSRTYTPYQQMPATQGIYALERDVRQLSLERTFQPVPDVVPLNAYPGNFSLGQVLAEEANIVTTASTTEELWDGKTLTFGSSMDVQQSIGESQRVPSVPLQVMPLQQTHPNVHQQVIVQGAVYTAQQSPIYTADTQRLLHQQRLVPVGIMSPVMQQSQMDAQQHGQTYSPVPVPYMTSPVTYMSPVQQYPIVMQQYRNQAQQPYSAQQMMVQQQQFELQHQFSSQQQFAPQQQTGSDFERKSVSRQSSVEPQWSNTQDAFTRLYRVDERRSGIQMLQQQNIPPQQQQNFPPQQQQNIPPQQQQNIQTMQQQTMPPQQPQRPPSTQHMLRSQDMQMQQSMSSQQPQRPPSAQHVLRSQDMQMQQGISQQPQRPSYNQHAPWPQDMHWNDQQHVPVEAAQAPRQVRGRQLSLTEAVNPEAIHSVASSSQSQRKEGGDDNYRRLSTEERRRISAELAAIGSWNEEVERSEREETSSKGERKISKDKSPAVVENSNDDFVFPYEDIRYAKKKPQSPVEQTRGIIILPQTAQKAEQRSQKKESPPKNIRPPPPERSLFDPSQGLPVNVNQPPPNVVRPPAQSQFGTAQTVDAQIAQGKPAWYSPYSKSMRESRCNPFTLMDIVRYDEELTTLLKTVGPLTPRIRELQHFFMNALLQIMIDDIKFCQTENVDSHIWKLAFYNVIEGIRRRKPEEPERVAEYDELLDKIVQEGTLFYQHVLKTLEEKYNLSFEEFIRTPQKKHHGMGMAGLALVAGQKVYISLGDLARYKEQAVDGSNANYGVAKEWYSKAQLLNPKNGKPYSQLALIAMLSKRKVDAVYYYIRSLMGSNPVESAKDTLVSLFEENRKRFEAQERKRREERLSNLPAAAPRTPVRQRKESEVRKEVWIHPMGGRRVHRAAATNHTQEEKDADMNELSNIPINEVNRRLMTSFVNYQAKLYTKIGMESFHEAVSLMLKEFKLVVGTTPLTLTPHRLLQMLALNMFSIDNTQLKGVEKNQSEYRSALQESALMVSLEMFKILIERCLYLHTLKEKSQAQRVDEGVILSAIKVWCDWLLCHSSIFNPPPTSDFSEGKSADVWTLLARLVTILDADVAAKSVQLFPQAFPGSLSVSLPEDLYLVGFPPLLLAAQDPVYVRPDANLETAIYCARVQRILYVCCDFLCGLDPPVLKLVKTSSVECLYLSAVGNKDENPADVDDGNLSDVSVESYSDNEEEKTDLSFLSRPPPSVWESTEVNDLLRRKDELERKHQSQERQKKKLKELLKNSSCIEMEVHPRLLVPDTNCFVDHLSLLQQLARAGPFTLAVPLVVCKELDGLSKRMRGTVGDVPERAETLSNAALEALNFLQQRHQHVRCYTTKGTSIQISSRTISMEEDDDGNGITNDDRILNCCLNLLKEDPYSILASEQGKKMVRDVVLLTDDRNLRVKALASDLPVRDLEGFYKWAMSLYH